MGLELEADGAKPESKKLYIALISELLKRKVVGEALLLSRLEADILQDVGVIGNASDFHKKQVKMNTR